MWMMLGHFVDKNKSRTTRIPLPVLKQQGHKPLDQTIHHTCMVDSLIQGFMSLWSVSVRVMLAEQGRFESRRGRERGP